MQHVEQQRPLGGEDVAEGAVAGRHEEQLLDADALVEEAAVDAQVHQTQRHGEAEQHRCRNRLDGVRAYGR